MKKEHNKLNLDMTDKSLMQFKKLKSISVATKLTDLKTSKIGELYDVKPVHDNMQRLCITKLQNKAPKQLKIPRKLGKEICTCLFEKNKNISIAELEQRIKNRDDTPASVCIKILDNYNTSKNRQHKYKSTKRKTTTTKRKTTTTKRKTTTK